MKIIFGSNDDLEKVSMHKYVLQLFKNNRKEESLYYDEILESRKLMHLRQ